MIAGEALVAEAEHLAGDVQRRLERAREQISAAGGDPGKVTVVAVTKTFGPKAPLAAALAGVRDIGENYADELVEKASALAGLEPAPVRWHFIGAIQRNKVGRLAPVVSLWQTLSREVEAKAIAGHVAPVLAKVLIEVNLAGDPGRPGCPLGEVPALVEAAREAGVEPLGLMAVAPQGSSESEAYRAFSTVAELARSLALSELSMGMSGDLEPAVRAGTTMVRLGTALFGPRNASAGR